MRTFKIVDSTKRKHIPAAWLTYDEGSKHFAATINKDYPTSRLPMALEPYARKGIYELSHKQVLPFVEERIVPYSRQNIGIILKEHSLGNYDELALLLSSGGRSSQDNFVVQEYFDAEYQYEIKNERVIAQEIGREIAAARKSEGLSQNELAARVGITQASLSRLETGKGNPTASMLEDVARALGKKLVVTLV